MKKTSKLFGAVALSAALAIGCTVPAFAAEEDSATKTDPDTNVSKTVEPTNVASGGATSYINVKTSVDQINVAIPLHATIVAKTSGEITAPNPKATGYRIENHSSFAIKVTDIDASEEKSDIWGLATEPVTGKDSAKSIGDVYLLLDMTNDEGQAITGNAPVQVNLGNAKTANPTLTNWTIEGAEIKSGDTKPTPTVKGLKLTGNCSNLNALTADDKATVDAFKITYTVGVQSNATPDVTHKESSQA